MHIPPFNINIIKPPEYIQRKQLLPVRSHAIFETSSRSFHPEGLYSEVIFGQIGSNDRLVRRGYMDLGTTVITPHIYKQIITLKSYYSDILAGKVYAYWDEDLCDFVKVPQSDERAETGYAFFIKHVLDIKFQESSSVKRHDKIALVEKFKDRILMNQLIVLPAGVRDIKEQDGRVAPEEINKIYLAILSLTQALPDADSDNPIYDGIRYQIQMKVQEVYAYIFNILTGKSGFISGKFTHRHVTYSNRNVITAPALSRVASPTSANKFGAEDVIVPLFQGMKAATPLVSHKLRTVMFNQVFGNGTNTVPLINPETKKLEYCEVETSEIRRFITSDGVNDLINGFRDVDHQKDPVMVTTKDGRQMWMYLVYDTGSDVYTFRNIEDFEIFWENKDGYHYPNFAALEGMDPHDYVITGEAATVVFGNQIIQDKTEVFVRPEVFNELKRGCTKNEFGAYVHENGLWLCNEDKRYNAKIDWTKLEQDSSILNVEGHYVTSARWLMEHRYNDNVGLEDKSKVKFLQTVIVDPIKIRPMTWVELFYIASFAATKDRYATSTRHPVLLIENIQVYSIHLVSTQPGRIVKLHTLQKEDPGLVLPEYPRLDQIVKTSMSVGPWTLAKYDGWSPSRGEIPLAA